MSTGACWKDNELQNMCAMLEFQQMSLQVHTERVSISFGTTLVILFGLYLKAHLSERYKTLLGTLLTTSAAMGRF